MDGIQPNSSTFDYFIAPLNLKSKNVSLIIRYSNAFSFTLMIRKSPSLIYFMDDDLLDLSALNGIPLKYKLRILRKTFLLKAVIFFLRPNIWVSSTYLKCKYELLNPHLLRPIASQALLKRVAFSKKQLLNSTRRQKICYHGTWSHQNEIKWLVPIIREVQSRCPNTTFEIIGGERVAKLFKGITRVEVLETMPWPQYLDHTSNVHQDIGLAPLMDTLFNRGRGPIKFFDYARAGAVGIYSKGPAFGEFVADGVDGFLLDNDPQLWIKKIVELVNNPLLRQSMADKAWEKVLDNSPASQSVQDYLNGFQT